MSAETQRREIRLRDPQVVGELLDRACAEVDDVRHAVMTSRDGLVIAADSGSRTEGDGEATIALHGSALAAAAASIGDHFSGLVSQGRLQSTVFEAERGCVGVFPMSSTLLLIVTSMPSVTPGRFTAAARRVVSTILQPDR
ncbi:roadblock/LC7 domain-containing protein [Amycolatopsis magusensis]|uniref:Regulator of Ras-like GTPase activity (Roadblock/LC7/MglB family) n=1 Tax=Amycolatopsis magusensis TaxID=882444 RepID=A0ABS4PVN0_9PSEU|nr:roadblock/LC7 domain-containing protein [Amycolatopsis magusensis]MBP2183483.1 putative regulator of Ras-like GTPase activity (Roadblock/LC7/MglB family) [Amycolatopsis magusensis]